IVPPYYMAPTPSQTMDHYRRIADAVSIPIVLYHNVPLTCVDLRTEHLIALFEQRAIGGVKMSNPEPDRICQLLQATRQELFVYAGLDTVAFEGLCHGAHGWISGIPSMVPRAARQLYSTIAEHGVLPAARQLWQKLAPLMRIQFSSYLSKGEGAHWFSVMKAALNMIGPPVGEAQPPVLPLQDAFRREIAVLLRELGYEVGGAA
ncbi:MAG: dihydrodipicolinate synthase family protein, partial [Pirellulales bacterium]|nr:dihydrodipicolinate synthase family protein [Pirellulales bacterium]